jgi:hypothetical protein
VVSRSADPPDPPEVVGTVGGFYNLGGVYRGGVYSRTIRKLPLIPFLPAVKSGTRKCIRSLVRRLSLNFLSSFFVCFIAWVKIPHVRFFKTGSSPVCILFQRVKSPSVCYRVQFPADVF